MKPLADWDNNNSSHPDLVWWSRLDGHIQVEVHRTDDYKGMLRIFDKDKGFDLLHEEEVGLSYGARFGPDVDDVARWKVMTVEIVDNKGDEQ